MGRKTNGTAGQAPTLCPLRRPQRSLRGIEVHAEIAEIYAESADTGTAVSTTCSCVVEDGQKNEWDRGTVTVRVNNFNNLTVSTYDGGLLKKNQWDSGTARHNINVINRLDCPTQFGTLWDSVGQHAWLQICPRLQQLFPAKC